MTRHRQPSEGLDVRLAASSYARTLRPEPRGEQARNRLDTLLALLAMAALCAALLWR